MYKKPQCPYCGKLDTLSKRGKFYLCSSCRRLTLKFAFASVCKGNK